MWRKNRKTARPWFPGKFFIFAVIKSLKLSLNILWIDHLKSKNACKTLKSITMYKTHRSRQFKVRSKNMMKHHMRVWINFSIVIHEKEECWMQLGSGGAVVLLPAAGPGNSPAGGPGKFDFYCSKSHRLAYCLLTFHVKFSAIWGIFV